MKKDIVSNALNQLMNAKRAKHSTIRLNSYSKLLISILALAKLKGYIKNYYIEKNILIVELGKFNGCKAIRPRFTAQVSQIAKYEKRYLPAKGFGMIIMTTSKGLMTNYTAKEKNIGGSLIAYMF